MKRILLLLLACLAVVPAQGQIAVQMNVKRRMHLLHEPVLATVSITNNSGRELMLDDTELGQWFSFTITGRESRVVPPRNPDYTLDPLQLQPGETVKRTVNLNELYQISEYGLHKIRANILIPGVNRYVASNPEAIDITEGREIWNQIVGVPGDVTDEEASRKYSLLTLDLDTGKHLYVRITGVENDVTYGCYPLGKLVDGIRPETQLDRGNNLWVLQLVAQKTYFLSRIGVNGEFQAQSTYVTPKTKPYLRKLADGTLQLVGALRQDRMASQEPKVSMPKLSDRPAGLPR